SERSSHGLPIRMPTTNRSLKAGEPALRQAADLGGDRKGMVLSLEPLHLPAEPLDRLDHLVFLAERVALSINAQHGDLDLRQMRVAQPLELPGRVQRVGEEQ